MTILVTIGYMCALSVPVALVVLVLTPLSVLAASWIARHSASSFRAQQEIQGELGGYTEEMMGNQALVSAFAQGAEVSATFAQINRRLYAAGERAQFVSSLTNPSTRVVNNLTYAAVAIVGCVCVIGGWPSALTVGQVQNFLLLFRVLYEDPRNYDNTSGCRPGSRCRPAHSARCPGAWRRPGEIGRAHV